MEIIQLLSFFHIVNTGSFSEASKKVFRTQSALSHMIKNLEIELNVQLLRRLPKQIELTQEGDILFRIAARFLKDLDQLKHMFADLQDGKIGNLSIAANTSFVSYILPNVIKAYRKQFPKINFKMVCCTCNSDVVSAVLKGDVDFGIGIKEYVIPEELSYFPLNSYDMFLLFCRRHFMFKKRRMRLSDIREYPLILANKATTTRRIIGHAFSKENLSYHVVMELSVAEIVKIYAAKGIGLAILPSYAIIPKDKKTLGIANVTHLFGRVDIGFYYRETTFISNAMRQFLRILSPELAPSLTAVGQRDKGLSGPTQEIATNSRRP